MSEVFKWVDDDSVVFGSVRAVAVYTNVNDEIVIRQAAGPGDEEDEIVAVPRDRMESLLLALKAELEADANA